MMFVGIGAVVVVVIILAINMSGSDQDPEEPKAEQPVTKTEKPATPKKSTPSTTNKKGKKKGKKNRMSRPLTEPDEPAPAIPSGLVAQVEAIYLEAKKLDVDARKAKKTDAAEFNRLINAAFDKVQSINPLIETQNDWLNEASMGDWRVPSSYSGLERMIGKVEKLKGRIRRVKPSRN